MDALPSGTVTMLFSDIEGSTALLRRLGSRYADVLSLQRLTLREAFRRWHGHEMGTEGDSFFVVFGRAGDGFAAALAAQRALAACAWPDGCSVRVRMAVHTGEPTRHEDGYVGLDVHLAARLAAAAHGGQVLVSGRTRSEVVDDLPAGVRLHDLGWHRFKDLPEPMRVHQLVAPDLVADFPPLKSLGAPSRLPDPPTRLVGRDLELATVHDVLADGDIRLLTLTGPGGSGKTRLALAAARQLDDMFNQGVYFVPLAAATDTVVAWQSIVGVIGAAGDGPPADLVAAQIADRPVLVVLDNLEQLAGAGELVHDLLSAAPRVTVIATSRRVLHLPGEYELPVPPLDLPPARASFAEIRTSGAVALFAMHAAMVKPGFTVTEDNEADVVAICERLDGLPLAIELAAARIKLLSPHSLRGRLDRSLGLSGGPTGRPDRHQTLRHTIGWSYDLLDDDLRRAFRALSVFVRGCDLDGFAAVALAPGGLAGSDPLDVLASLVDLNLSTVREGPDGEPRAGMLVTIREFAGERLAETDDAEAVRRRHAEYYAGFAEQAAERLSGSERLRWLDRLEVEHDNLRAALSWALPADRTGPDDGRASIGLRLVGPLTWFWYGHGHAAEGRRWLERAVDQNAEGTGSDYARAVHGLGVLLIQQGEHEAAQRPLERALQLWRALDDPEQVARVLSSLGVMHRMVGELDVARPLLEESIAIARGIGAEERLTTGLSNLAVVEVDARRNDHAIALLEECLEIDERNGDPSDVLIDKTNLVGGLAFGGRPDAALALLRSILTGIAALGDVELTTTAVELAAVIAAALGAATSAARLVGAAESMRDQAEMPAPAPDIALLERALGPVREVLGDPGWARECALGRTFDQAEALALAAAPEPAAVAEHIGQQAVTTVRPSGGDG